MVLRGTFERELQQVQDELLRLGSEVEENLIKAVDAFKRRDLVRSQQLITADSWVNERRIAIGNACLTLIATQQPIAKDMRLIAATIEIVGELERIHDYVKGIAKINLMINDTPLPRYLLEQLPPMAEKAREMLHHSLTAFGTRDATLAHQVAKEDDVVDDMYNHLYREIIAYIVQNPDSLEQTSRLEWAVHNLERSADRVTNICEWVVYVVTGVYKEFEAGNRK